jgi:hypothetical protein
MRGVAPTIATDSGFIILCIDASWLLVQVSIFPRLPVQIDGPTIKRQRCDGSW